MNFDELSAAPSYPVLQTALANQAAATTPQDKIDKSHLVGQAVCKCLDELGKPKGNWVICGSQL